jgi:hypothetical protein
MEVKELWNNYLMILNESRIDKEIKKLNPIFNNNPILEKLKEIPEHMSKYLSSAIDVLLKYIKDNTITDIEPIFNDFVNKYKLWFQLLLPNSFNYKSYEDFFNDFTFTASSKEIEDQLLPILQRSKTKQKDIKILQPYLKDKDISLEQIVDIYDRYLDTDLPQKNLNFSSFKDFSELVNYEFSQKTSITHSNNMESPSPNKIEPIFENEHFQIFKGDTQEKARKLCTPNYINKTLKSNTNPYKLCIGNPNSPHYYNYRFNHEIMDYFIYFKDIKYNNVPFIIISVSPNGYTMNKVNPNNDTPMTKEEIQKEIPELTDEIFNDYLKEVPLSDKELYLKQNIYHANSILELETLKDRLLFIEMGKPVSPEEWEKLPLKDQLIRKYIKIGLHDLPKFLKDLYPELWKQYDESIKNRVMSWLEEPNTDLTEHEIAFIALPNNAHLFNTVQKEIIIRTFHEYPYTESGIPFWLKDEIQKDKHLQEIFTSTIINNKTIAPDWAEPFILNDKKLSYNYTEMIIKNFDTISKNLIPIIKNDESLLKKYIDAVLSSSKQPPSWFNNYIQKYDEYKEPYLNAIIKNAWPIPKFLNDTIIKSYNYKKEYIKNALNIKSKYIPEKWAEPIIKSDTNLIKKYFNNFMDEKNFKNIPDILIPYILINNEAIAKILHYKLTVSDGDNGYTIPNWLKNKLLQNNPELINTVVNTFNFNYDDPEFVDIIKNEIPWVKEIIKSYIRKFKKYPEKFDTMIKQNYDLQLIVIPLLIENRIKGPNWLEEKFKNDSELRSLYINYSIRHHEIEQSPWMVPYIKNNFSFQRELIKSLSFYNPLPDWMFPIIQNNVELQDIYAEKLFDSDYASIPPWAETFLSSNREFIIQAKRKYLIQALKRGLRSPGNDFPDMLKHDIQYNPHFKDIKELYIKHYNKNKVPLPEWLKDNQTINESFQMKLKNIFKIKGLL